MMKNVWMMRIAPGGDVLRIRICGAHYSAITIMLLRIQTKEARWMRRWRASVLRTFAKIVAAICALDRAGAWCAGKESATRLPRSDAEPTAAERRKARLARPKSLTIGRASSRRVACWARLHPVRPRPLCSLPCQPGGQHKVKNATCIIIISEKAS